MENKKERLNRFIKKWECYEIYNINDWTPNMLEKEVHSCYDEANELFDIGDVQCVDWSNDNEIGYTISEFENMVASLVENAIQELKNIENKEELLPDLNFFQDYKFEKSACASIVRVETKNSSNKIYYSVWVKERNFYKKFYVDEYEVYENQWFIKFKKIKSEKDCEQYKG